jgi:hypothetical protein
MNHPLSCRCGSLKGSVSHSVRVNRCICYCKDCQAFAHFLGQAADILDEQGGTDIVQTLPANVTFSQGQGALACMRLTEKGVLRWYAACCNTPIGNTLINYRVSFVGLIHNCLSYAGTPLADTFGPVRMWVNTGSASGKVPSNAGATIAGMARFGAMIIGARMNGGYRRTPFFAAETGTPIAIPKILTAEELAQVSKAAGARAA